MAQTFPFPSRATAGGVRIHPTALVDGTADLGVDVEIGPFCIVEAGARIGDRTRLGASAFVAGNSDIASDCELHLGAAVGGPAQIRDWKGAGGGTLIGARTILREYVTVHRASRAGQYTVVAADNFLMSGSHVAHDCRTGNGVTIANGSLLAGCVELGDQVFVSGNVVVHQFVRIGRLAMIGGLARVSKDVPPFMLIGGDSKVCGVNIVGIRRANMSADERQAVRRAYRILYRSGQPVSRAVEQLQAETPSPQIETMLAFIATSTRGLCAPRTRRRAPSLARED